MYMANFFRVGYASSHNFKFAEHRTKYHKLLYIYGLVSQWLLRVQKYETRPASFLFLHGSLVNIFLEHYHYSIS